MTLILLPSKFQRPRLGSQMVPRAALIQRLNDGTGAPLTLLSAPAGFGKTTLISAWSDALEADAASAASGRAAWLTLDSHDNDPLRFWSYVTVAFLQVTATGSDSLGGREAASSPRARALSALLERLHAADLPPLDETVDALLQALYTSNGENSLQSDADSRVVLVLDDYHQIYAPTIHHSVHYFIAHLPASVRVVILTRQDPPFPLQRWRAYGELAELRASDLCFTVEEAGALLSRRSRVVLPRETLAAVVAHTDGWPVGLQLLAASLQGRNLREADQLASDLGQSSRFVLDYLLEEVLQSQPEPVREYLLRTSIVHRVCAALGDELMDVRTERGTGPWDGASSSDGAMARPDARTIRRYLEEHNLFVIPIDDDHEWFRYYHLFSDALSEEIGQRDPALTRALHARAARWYLSQGMSIEATEHAFAAQEWDLAGDTFAGIAHSMMVRGDFRRLFDWLDRLPDSALIARPPIVVTKAYLMLLRGPLQEVEHMIHLLLEPLQKDGAEKSQRPGNPGESSIHAHVAGLSALLAAFRWQVREARTLGEEALRWLDEDDSFARVTTYHALGRACESAGALDAATQYYEASIAASRTLEGPSLGLFPATRLSRVLEARGQLQAAERACRRMLRTAIDHGGEEWPIVSDVYIQLADLAREHNDLLAAEYLVRRGLALAPVRGFEIYAWGCAVQAHISQALGRRDGSRAALAAAAEAAPGYNNPLLAGWLRAHLARIDLMAGDVDAARLWASSWSAASDLAGYAPVFEEVTLARVALADHRPRAALAALQPLEARSVRTGAIKLLVEIIVLIALCHAALNQRAQATEALLRALELAEGEGFRRVFLDEGDRIFPLLEALSPQSTYAASLLGALRGARIASQASDDVGGALERLTPRELEILRALARGSSNQDIAATYVLTVGTVKGHVNHILGKLNARNRTEAVARARELGLI